MSAALICDAVRTPIGRYGGALASVRTDDLASIPIRALLDRSGIDPAIIDEVVLGCANQAGEDNRNVARIASLLAGLPATVPAYTVNRLCASGADAVASAARAIACGEIDLAIAGGVESMTRAPFVLPKAAGAFARSTEIYDTTIGWRFVNEVFAERFGTDSMPETAENVAGEYSVSRDAQDDFALRSQERAGAAQASGYFADEIVPVAISERRQTHDVVSDEHPRKDTTREQLSHLRPIVRKDGTVTAGNASGVNDGAVAILLASAAAADRHGLRPRARVLGAATAGVEPRRMGIGPVAAVRKLLERLSLRMSDFDVIEINEAFASQVIACLIELGVSPEADFVNPHGGAIALGHPLGMSGARLVQTAVHALGAGQGRRALVTMCVGVGQGVAVAIERVET